MADDFISTPHHKNKFEATKPQMVTNETGD
jgi:hypothetical protein